MPRRQIDRRAKLLAKLDKQFTKAVEKLQRQFYNQVRDFYEKQLALSEGAIKSTAGNYARVAQIEKLTQTFIKKESTKISAMVAKNFASIIAANQAHFSAMNPVPKAVKEKVRRDLLARYGIKKVGSTYRLSKGGLLANLANVADPFLRVQEVAINAVSRGVAIEVFRKDLKAAVFSTGARTIVHHFRTHANDIYAQFDRSVHVNFAENLGLQAFMYEGGLIDTTRDFCERNSGQVFTIEEAEGWRALEWNGKNKDYEPLRDMGGHNCRHIPRFISNELAISLRPELKDLLK